MSLSRKLNNMVIDNTASLHAVGVHNGRFGWTTWSSPTSSTSSTYAHRGDNDVWVQKMAADGRTLWVTVFGSSGRDDGRSVVVDSRGDVVVAGTFVFDASHPNPMQIGRFMLTNATSPAGTASNDIFVAKLSSTDGAVQWARQFGGTGADEAVSVGIRSDGGIVLAGTTTSSSLNLDGLTLTNPGAAPMVFVAHLSRDGVVTSASAQPSVSSLSKMVVDPASDAVYLVGTDYVARLGSWTTSLAGTTGIDRRRGLALDPSSRYLFVGAHFNRASITLGGTVLQNRGEMDGYVARLDAGTGAIQFAVGLGGGGQDYVHALAVDADSVMVSGKQRTR